MCCGVCTCTCVCCIQCWNQSNRETHLSCYSLPLTNKHLLKIWVHKVKWINLQRNSSTWVCSDCFLSAALVRYSLQSTLCKNFQRGPTQLQQDQGTRQSLEQFQSHRLKPIATNRMFLSIKVLGYKCGTTHK